MAKSRVVLPPKQSIRSTVQKIVKSGPKQPVKLAVAKGPNISKTTTVQASRIPKPAQNQRGRIKSRDDRDLTR